MIISRTPFRMSFFGGGTDYPAWSREHGGAVLATTINKYCYISARYLPPFFAYRSRILYSKVEMVERNEQIEHPAVRAVLAHYGIDEGMEIHHDGDLPARTGLGSSSSFAVGILHALSALKKVSSTKMQLAREAIHIEQEVLKENVGCQDQVIAALGGFQRIDFAPDGGISATDPRVSRERLQELQSHILLYFTGFSRIASLIVKEQLKNIPDKKSELSRMREMVDEAQAILRAPGGLARFGALLDESWKLKRGLSSQVSTPAIDEIYEAARSAGALGGKLLGAGGGGFLMFFVRPEDQPRVKERLKKLLLVPIKFETEGSHIILDQPED
jgi:D-glycero-alpha-D-manno-heptose-7-phosphate kinase